MSTTPRKVYAVVKPLCVHVLQAAWGGGVLMSQKHRSLLDGIHR